MAEEWHPFSKQTEGELSVTKRDSLVSFDLIRVVGQPINSGTDINVIAEAAGSCLSYDPLFKGKNQQEGNQREGNEYNHLLRKRKRGSAQNCVCTTDSVVECEGLSAIIPQHLNVLL